MSTFMSFNEDWMFWQKIPSSQSMAILRCGGRRPKSLTKVPPLQLHSQAAWGDCGEANGVAEKLVRKNTYDTAASRVEMPPQSWFAGLCR